MKPINVFLLVSIFMMQACQTMPPSPMPVAANLDLEQYMGRWYVIANIPTPFERDAYNAIEDYAMVGDNKIATTFSFRRGAFDGEYKRMTATGFVSPENPAIWGMRFVWPIKADFRVLYVDDDHQFTIIGRQKRDYLWIMARSPVISDEAYEYLLAVSIDRGYDIREVQRVPQQSLAERNE